MSDISAKIIAKIQEAKNKRLKTLDLSSLITNLELEEFPEQILELENLERLNLADNTIAEISREIYLLKNLKYLNLTGNILREFPKPIFRLAKFIFSKNRLAYL